MMFWLPAEKVMSKASQNKNNLVHFLLNSAPTGSTTKHNKPAFLVYSCHLLVLNRPMGRFPFSVVCRTCLFNFYWYILITWYNHRCSAVLEKVAWHSRLPISQLRKVLCVGEQWTPCKIPLLCISFLVNVKSTLEFSIESKL